MSYLWLGPTVLHWRAGLVAELPGATNWETFLGFFLGTPEFPSKKLPPTRQNVKPDLQLLDDPPSPATTTTFRDVTPDDNRNNG